MEKKNNVIAREDGKQFVGYIADLQVYFARQAQTMLDCCALEMFTSETEEDFKKLDRYIYVMKDLAGYTDSKNVLAKVTVDDEGYWYVSVIY